MNSRTTAPPGANASGARAVMTASTSPLAFDSQVRKRSRALNERSWDAIKRIGQEERHLRVTTGQVGRLIAGIGNDRVPVPFDPLAHRCLEVRGRCVTGAVRFQVKSPIAGKTHRTKILDGCRALPLIPAGN